MARAGAWLLGIVACVFALPARAESVSVPVRLELVGPFTCVSARELSSALQSRNGRVRLAAGDEPAARLRVRVSETPRGLRGELEVQSPDGTTSRRAVDGTSCRAVVEALSLSAALALQQSADQVVAPREVRAPAGVASDTAPTPASRARTFTIEVGAQASLSQPVTPHLNAGGGLLGRARYARGPQPSLSLAVLHSRNELFESSRHVAVRMTGVTLSACPLRVRLLAPLALEPCASATAARLQAWGRDLPSSAGVARSWWGLGALVRLSISLLPDVLVELEGGALVPLVERRFVVLPSGASLGETPMLAPLASAGLVYAL